MITVASYLQSFLQRAGRALIWVGGWALRGAAAVQGWIKRRGDASRGR